MQQQTPQPDTFDFAAMVADLNRLLRLKTTVIGMKLFERADEMAASRDAPAEGRPRHRPDRQHGLAPGLDGWHYLKRSGRRAVPRGGRA